MRYTSSWGIVHYATDRLGNSVETHIEDGEILGKTNFIGVYPTAYYESGNGVLELVSTIEYAEQTQLAIPKPSRTWQVKGTAHYTDFAFLLEGAHSENRLVSLIAGAPELLFIGKCKYSAILVRTVTTSPKPTIYSSVYYLPELGIRIHQSVGQENFAKIMVSITAVEISNKPL